MAILIQAVDYPGRAGGYMQAMAEEDKLFMKLKDIPGYAVFRPDRVKSIKYLRNTFGIDLKQAKDIVDNILDGTLF